MSHLNDFEDCTLLTYKEEWDKNTKYKINDVVLYFKNTYQCIKKNCNVPPYNNTDYWELLILGCNDEIKKEIPEKKDSKCEKKVNKCEKKVNKCSKEWQWDHNKHYDHNEHWDHNEQSEHSEQEVIGSIIFNGCECCSSVKEDKYIQYPESPKGLPDLIEYKECKGNNKHNKIDCRTFFFRGPWKVTDKYNKDDVVTYNGSTYIATTEINCNNNDITNSYLWRVIARGVSYKSNWKKNTSYQENCLVKFEDNVYICLKAHKSKHPPNESECWELFSEKGKDGICPKIYHIKYMGEWTMKQYYRVNHIVRYKNIIYMAIKEHKDKKPDKCSDYWEMLVKDGEPGKIIEKCCSAKSNIKHVGCWKTCSKYCPGEIVRHKNASYIAKTENNNREPSEKTIHWGLLAKDSAKDNNSETVDNTEAKFLYATIYKGGLVNEDDNEICKNNFLNRNGDICICLDQYIVELKFNICKYNNNFYNIELDDDNTSLIKFKKEGFYRITYNVTYLSKSKFTLYTYFDDSCCIYPGESTCIPTNGDDGVTNHTFYIGISEDDCNRLLKIFLINKNCEEFENTTEQITLMNKRCWIAIEYVGQ